MPRDDAGLAVLDKLLERMGPDGFQQVLARGTPGRVQCNQRFRDKIGDAMNHHRRIGSGTRQNGNGGTQGSVTIAAQKQWRPD